jgi:hypothetical protein
MCGVVGAQEQSAFVDYGNGILFYQKSTLGYSSGASDFGIALSQYLTNNPDKHVVSIVADASSEYGLTRGFYVVVENKTIAVPTPSISMNCTPSWDGTRVGTTALANYYCEGSP